ncbi:hypothetical protein KFL_002600180 [Klebsormidium nitens]|uniref:Haloacid dehalogenase-like hydrolase (HAD) superfamily protein n=1 Tax=Klebsormidium nitens TaxID=105231 RepID=A0A1Y1I4P4_KLENI|nr:hypothetical protein KFL_002600180 [Klebsormidium nitens]|eukprot:GAQ85910.1 hypothetical protein KFL_002600180 [Klebsormidium nitens]
MDQVLISFDVDGTLIRSIGEDANAFHKRAFSYVMKQIYGVDGTIDAIKHHGSTDKQVLINTLAHYGVPPSQSEPRVPEATDKMLEYARLHPEEVSLGLEILPGVAALLQELHSRKTVLIGLVTGNLEEIAWMKMMALGIYPFFSTPQFGGFGSDHIERGELVKVARRRAEELFPGGIKSHFHVGDTPADIQAASYGGAHAVGVCTGVFSALELTEAGKGNKHGVTILTGLADQSLFLQTVGL